MKHRLDCPCCGERFPRMRMFYDPELWRTRGWGSDGLGGVTCPSCKAKLVFSTNSGICIQIGAAVAAAIPAVLLVRSFDFDLKTCATIILLVIFYLLGERTSCILFGDLEWEGP
jgi:hypothetical protein